jgi:pimeloyl-ACP methyl ester carboxylesterase
VKCVRAGESALTKIITSSILIAVLVYVAACLYLYLFQRTFLYFPTPQVSVPHAENISLKSDGETLRIWHIGSGENAIIYFGGNAEDVSYNIPLFLNLFPHHSLYLVNYRGYGGSTGSPGEAGLYKDAVTVFDFVRTRHAKVSVIGRSLGSGVAVYLASVREIRKLVLVTPFDSIEAVARRHFPIFPTSFLLKDKFLSSTHAQRIKAQTLVIVAGRDEVIPRENSEALIAALPGPQTVVEFIPETDHDSVGMSERYLKSLREFLAGS